MIRPLYEDIFKRFIENYEDIHVCPWHEISKEELNRMYEDLCNNMDINNQWKFTYMMNYIIKD